MSPTGNKWVQSGFTLIEILITVSIVSLATVFIVQSNLTNLSAFGRYENRLDIQQWSLEKIADTKRAILESETPESGISSGTVSGKTRPYNWKLEVTEETTKFGNVYFIDLSVSWLQGSQEVLLERHSGVLKSQTL